MIKFATGTTVKLQARCWFSSGAGIVPFYWFADQDSNWFNVSNWFLDQNHTQAAGALPGASNNVYVVGSTRPIANLDGEDTWVNPNAINVGTAGIGLTGTNKTIQTNFMGTGVVSVSGSITILDPTL